MDYFFTGSVKAFTNSTDHRTLKLTARTPLSFVRQVRKILREYEPQAQLRCNRDFSLVVFTVDRNMKTYEIPTI